jgi:hypothetical protein
LKSKYGDANDAIARNEMLFIEHANETLSNPNSRSLYDRQIANVASPSFVRYEQYEQSDNSLFSSSKLIMVIVGVLALVAYGLNTRHSEEIGKIDVAKEAVVGNNDVARISVDGNLQNTSKAIDVSADIAQRRLTIQQQEADTRRMESENRIRANEEATKQRVVTQTASQKSSAEREERCRYMRSLITQANQAGAYAEARALQARGCN